jgi:hypothetical protein
MDLPRRLLMALGFQTLDLLMEFVTPPKLNLKIQNDLKNAWTFRGVC